MTPSSPRLSRRDLFTRRFADTKASSLPRLYTPNDAFFTSMQPQIPRLKADYWSLTIGGLVEHPVTWSYADLMALPMIEIEATLLCASNEPGGERIGHARWRGVPLSMLLDDVKPLPDLGISHLWLEGADEHLTGVPLKRGDDALVAFEMNGAPLTPEQGYPARVIVPGLYDYKSPRWITNINLVPAPVLGDWEINDYSLTGEVETTAAITSHRPREIVSGNVPLEGYAFAGNRAIDSVEISIDSGAWTSIPFTQGPSGSWSRWALDWQPAATGDHAVAVRATDANGQTQPTAHTLVLRVEA